MAVGVDWELAMPLPGSFQGFEVDAGIILALAFLVGAGALLGDEGGHDMSEKVLARGF
jgi:hypothetical protein